jgi:nitrite reductase/ring-hydroxylating ferredoxin subunit
MGDATELDLERVICRLSDLDATGARAFTIGEGAWPMRGFVVRAGEEIRGYINHCPHAGHPLNLRPHGFLTADGALILCSSHGALFEKMHGLCIAGPCSGQSLRAVPLQMRAGCVLLADGVDPAQFADRMAEPPPLLE